jgi:soluble lytic murein transglycosylase
MLLAFSRLHAADPARAQAAHERALARAEAEPFKLERGSAFEEPATVRALELLRVGDIDAARSELSTVETLADGSQSWVWGMALLYSRAGAVKLSHDVARGSLVEWLGRWPAGQWRTAWELSFPRPYLSIVQSQAKRAKVDESLIFAIMREESAFDPQAVSPANAYGLMQLIKPTARHYAKKVGVAHDERSLLTPQVNITLGSEVLSSFGSMFPNNQLLAIPGYNAGPGRPKRWLSELPSRDLDLWVEMIPFYETRHYMKRVLASRATYRYLYGELGPEAALTLPTTLSTTP